MLYKREAEQNGACRDSLFKGCKERQIKDVLEEALDKRVAVHVDHHPKRFPVCP